MTKPKKTRKVRDKKSEDYVDNKKFSQAIADWREENKNNGKRKNWTQMPEYIGDCCLKIVNHFAYQSSWRGYTYLDIMKAEAILNLIKGIHNYDIKQNPSAFNYASEVVRKSFIFIKDQEVKQTKIRTDVINQQSIYSTDKINLYDEENGSDEGYYVTKHEESDDE